MSSYSIRYFENTGFNSANLPWSKDDLILAATAYHDIDNVDLVQNRFLNSVTISAPWSQVNQCDYVIIYNNTEGTREISINTNGWCYLVVGVTMQASDVVTLSLVPDYLTSVDGARRLAGESADGAPITIVDGLVTRSTYTLRQWMDGDLSVYDIDLNDSLLTPSGSMELQMDKSDRSTSFKTILLSTINIPEAGTTDLAKAFTVSGSTLTSDKVVVPTVPYITTGNSLDFRTYSTTANGGIDSSTFHIQPWKGVCAIFNEDVYANSDLQKGLTNLRALGLEGALIDQYMIPTDYISYNKISGSDLLDNITGVIEDISELTGWTGQETYGNHHTGTISSLLNFSPYETMGIMTATGSKVECQPQDLFFDDMSQLSHIEVRVIVDPRPDGKPYYGIKYLHGLKNNMTNILIAAAEGLQWQKVPLIFNNGASGNALNTIRYQTGYNLNKQGYDMSTGYMKQLQDLNMTPGLVRASQSLADWNSSRGNKNNAIAGSSTNVTSNKITSQNASTVAPPGVQHIVPADQYEKTFMSGLYNIGADIKSGITGAIDSAVEANVNAWNKLANTFPNAMNEMSSMLIENSNRVLQNVWGVLDDSDIFNQLTGRDIQKIQNESALAQQAFGYQKGQILDAMEYAISNGFYTPTIMFPYNTMIFDFIGNRVIRYRYTYKPTDARRVTKIIKAYGIKYNTELNSNYFGSDAMMTNADTGTDYLYIQTQTCTVTGRAKWINDGIAAQLNGGVRFWCGRPEHIKPTSEEYGSNT